MRIQSSIHALLSAALLAGSATTVNAETFQFSNKSGQIWVTPESFSDAVGRMLIRYEAPDGATQNFESLFTLGRVSHTTFFTDGHVTLEDQCNGAVFARKGHGNLGQMNSITPALQGFIVAANPSNADSIAGSCSACSAGNRKSCLACASKTLDAFAFSGQCSQDKGDGSDNGDNGDGGTGTDHAGQPNLLCNATATWASKGDGSDNGDNGEGGSGKGDGSDNGDNGDDGTGKAFCALIASR